VLRIQDVYPGSWILILTHSRSRISDPRSQISDTGSKNSHKFHKIENYFIFEVLKKKILVSFQRYIELFIHKFVISSQKYGFGIRDPEFEIQDPEKKNLFQIPDPGPGVKKAPDPRSRIRIRNTGNGFALNAATILIACSSRSKPFF
jgi:hypothetical protein